MSFKVVIPARYASSRLPAKPLVDIAGKPMIQHVYEAACLSDAEEVIIATDHEDIVRAAESFNAKVCLTQEDHTSGTDRLQEVSDRYACDGEQIIVNVQGDEPLIKASLINQVALNLQSNTWASIATLSEKIIDKNDLLNPNAVKVVCALNGEALYFSRAPIPWMRDSLKQNQQGGYQISNEDFSTANFFRHIGIYAYRSAFLNEYVKWSEAPIEQAESLEQLRAMYMGHKIHVEAACEAVAPGVDTEEDLAAIRAIFESQ